MDAKWLMRLMVLAVVMLFVAACGKNMAMGDCDTDGDCPAGQSCEDGFCFDEDDPVDDSNDKNDDVCDANETWCDGECVDTYFDRDHCGGCGNVCDDDLGCWEGECAMIECPGTLVPCGVECVDIDSDVYNCGGCGVQCDDEEVCEMGECLMEVVPICDREASPFGGGDGSEEDPYTICTADHLRAVDDHLDASFLLVEDIDMAGEPFEVIGDYTGAFGEWEDVFEGHFDGTGHAIMNLTVDGADESAVGLFGINDGGVITNVTLEQVEVYGDRYVGALAGINDGEIAGSSVNGTVEGSSNVGAIAGYNGSDAVLDTVSATASVGATEIVGGVVGENLGVLSEGWAEVDVEGEERVGGLVGDNRGDGPCEIANSTATGDVVGVGVDDGGWQSQPPLMVGGLVGRHHVGCLIEDSVAEGDVTAEQTQAVGGLVGWARPQSQILNSQAFGDVTGANFTGGLAGRVSSVGGEDWSEEQAPVVGAQASGQVSGGDFTGGLVGRLEGTVDESHATGDVAGQSYTGGLVGHVRETDWGTQGTVIDSYAEGGLVGGTDEVGGLVGRNEGLVSRSYADHSVEGGFRVGGLVGENQDVIRESFAVGDVTNSGNSTGGLVGRLYYEGAVVDSYATGDVEGVWAVGGLVGAVVEGGGGFGPGGGEPTTGEVTTSYSTGGVQGSGSTGGLVGLNEDDDPDENVVDSYWNVGSSGMDDSAGGVRLNDEQFGEESNFVGFGFGSVWEMGADRPQLSWE